MGEPLIEPPAPPLQPFKGYNDLLINLFPNLYSHLFIYLQTYRCSNSFVRISWLKDLSLFLNIMKKTRSLKRLSVTFDISFWSTVL